MIHIAGNQDSLPEYIYAPDTTGDARLEEHLEYLGLMTRYGEKIMESTATRQERRRYHELRIALLEAKIETISSDLDAVEQGMSSMGKQEELEREIEMGNATIRLLKNEIDKSMHEISSL